MTAELERAIARFRPKPRPNGDVAGRISAAAFRAAVEQRLSAVERDLADLKGRINGLIFVVAGAVLTQLILRVMA